MSDHNGDGRRRRPDVFITQLRGFDEKLANFRTYYDNFEAEDRPRFRAWLERAIALSEEESEFGALIRIQTEHDQYDSDGNLVGWADAEFTPATMMSAIRAWEAGNEYAPSSVRP